MGCLYLHIGTPKTGTTSIQYFLNKNRDVFSEKGYCVPDLGYRFDKVHKNRNAHFLVQRYFDEQGKRLHKKEKNLREEGMKQVIDYLAQYDNVILSDESIYNQSYRIKNFWEKLIQSLSEHGHSLKVIVYLRRQDAYVRSYWTQSVKAGEQQMDFADYIKSKAIERLHSDYSIALDRIASVIGQENVIVRPFERSQMMNGDLYTDFLNCLGLSLTGEFICVDQMKNDAVAGEYIRVKQILNANSAFSVRKGFLLSFLENTTRQRGEKADYRRATLFPDNEPERYLEQYSAGNKMVARKYLNREDGVLFVESPESEKDLVPYSTEELVLACGDLMLQLKNDYDKAVADKHSLKTQLKVLKNLIKNRIKRISKKKTS